MTTGIDSGRYALMAHNEDWTETVHSTDDNVAAIAWAVDMSRLEYVEFVTVTNKVANNVRVFKGGEQIG